MANATEGMSSIQKLLLSQREEELSRPSFASTRSGPSISQSSRPGTAGSRPGTAKSATRRPDCTESSTTDNNALVTSPYKHSREKMPWGLKMQKRSDSDLKQRVKNDIMGKSKSTPYLRAMAEVPPPVPPLPILAPTDQSGFQVDFHPGNAFAAQSIKRKPSSEDTVTQGAIDPLLRPTQRPRDSYGKLLPDEVCRRSKLNNGMDFSASLPPVSWAGKPVIPSTIVPKSSNASIALDEVEEIRRGRTARPLTREGDVAQPQDIHPALRTSTSSRASSDHEIAQIRQTMKNQHPFLTRRTNPSPPVPRSTTVDPAYDGSAYPPLTPPTPRTPAWKADVRYFADDEQNAPALVLSRPLALDNRKSSSLCAAQEPHAAMHGADQLSGTAKSTLASQISPHCSTMSEMTKPSVGISRTLANNRRRAASRARQRAEAEQFALEADYQEALASMPSAPRPSVDTRRPAGYQQAQVTAVREHHPSPAVSRPGTSGTVIHRPLSHGHNFAVEIADALRTPLEPSFPRNALLDTAGWDTIELDTASRDAAYEQQMREDEIRPAAPRYSPPARPRNPTPSSNGAILPLLAQQQQRRPGGQESFEGVGSQRDSRQEEVEEGGKTRGCACVVM